MVLKNMRLKTKLTSEKGRKEVLADNYVGFYLHCHHNFYLPFAGKNINFQLINPDMILHHFNLLLTHEVLDSLIQVRSLLGVELTERARKAIIDFVEAFLETKIIIIQDTDVLEQAKTSIEREVRLVEKHIIDGRISPILSGASYLRDFCRVLSENVELIGRRRIYFLLDDYSDARGVTESIQKSLNRIIGYRNDRFCFKISTERYAFIPRDLDGKELQQDREFRYIDIGREYLSLPNEEEAKEFIREILDKRLTRAKERRTVTELFGTYKFPGMNIGSSLADPKLRKQTLFAGFNCIYNLCSGDVSTLLELCRDIYRDAIAKKKLPENPQQPIDFELQDGVIREFSRGRIAMIKEIQEYGDQLFMVVDAVGEISRKYLYEYGQIGRQTGRYQEKIRIEVAGAKTLDPKVALLYQSMIKNGIFTDWGPGYPWGTTINNLRLIMRRVYAPAYAISYRNRECIRMAPDKFEHFLQDPQWFVKHGTEFLEKTSDQAKLS